MFILKRFFMNEKGLFYLLFYIFYAISNSNLIDVNF